MAFSEIEEKRIDSLVGALCRAKSPAKYRNELKYSYEIDGHAVSIWEERPRWDNPTEWTKMGIARFRYIKAKREWKLYWMRRDLKWHSYDPEVSTAKSLEPLVRVVAEDKWGALFG